MLPFAVESFLGWSLALGCLSVSGFYYLREVYLAQATSWLQTRRPVPAAARLAEMVRDFFAKRATALLSSSHPTAAAGGGTPLSSLPPDGRGSSPSSLPCWLPLTTFTKAEASRATPMERYRQLVRLLNYYCSREGGGGGRRGRHFFGNDESAPASSAAAAAASAVAGAGGGSRREQRGRLAADPVQERRQQQPQPENEDVNEAGHPPPPDLSDRDFVNLFREHVVLRRLATLAMRPADLLAAPSPSAGHHGHAGTAAAGSDAAVAQKDVSQLPLGRQLARCWGYILQLPREEDDDDAVDRFQFEISLIVPCYGERGDQVWRKLDHASSCCSDPGRVQLVLLNAGECTDLADRSRVTPTAGDKTGSWGEVKVVDLSSGADDDDNDDDRRSDARSTTDGAFSGGHGTASNSSANRQQQQQQQQTNNGDVCSNGYHHRQRTSHRASHHNNSNQRCKTTKGATVAAAAKGRGPCLNVGAERASGRILSFCHSDTRLPRDWDVSILRVFNGGGDGDGEAVPEVRRTANSCAFGFSVDTSPSGLSDGWGDSIGKSSDSEHPNGYYPPGIRGVEWTANARCRWWKLPYGDQCLSIPARVFKYLGGYPHEPIMEDYDLIKLLRQRAALLPRFRTNNYYSDGRGRVSVEEEELVIIPGEPAMCSPRRWQKHGVLYVTYTNSRLVRQYENDRLTPEDIYELYYGRRLPCSTSPWEGEVEATIPKTTLDEAEMKRKES